MNWGDRGHCPKCGRFCGNIKGQANEHFGLFKVTGMCKIHGVVDLTQQAWEYDDFFSDEVLPPAPERSE